MTTKKDPDEMTVAVVVTVTVSRREWMEKYGKHITANQLVPEVTLEKTIKKAVSEKLHGLLKKVTVR